MDGVIRDLAELRNSYMVIDKTERAIALIGKALEESKVEKVVFYLDAPVSNVGRLKQKIIDLLYAMPFDVEVQVIENVDRRHDNQCTKGALFSVSLERINTTKHEK